MNKSSLAIRDEALRLGFSDCGIVRATRLDAEGVLFSEWLQKGMNAGMEYMNANMEKRLNPAELLPGARSVICVLMNYAPQQLLNHNGQLHIARYAYGADYHYVLKNRLWQLADFIVGEPTDHSPENTVIRALVDSAPVLERSWAVRANLGWIGNNSCLITHKGSFFFIGTILTTLELDELKGEEHFSGCGLCRRCMDACPNGAIVAPHTVDARRCISYQTIENRAETLPEDFQTNGCLVGCDICQEVCPWNRKATPTPIPELQPSPALQSMTDEDWENLSRSTYKQITKQSAISRVSYQNLKRNIKTAQKEE